MKAVSASIFVDIKKEEPMTTSDRDISYSKKGTTARTYESLPFLDVLSPEYANDPLGTMRALGEGQTMARSQRGMEFLTYDLCWDLMREEHFPSDWKALVSAGGLTPEDEAYQLFALNLNALEGEEHRHQRHLLNPVFSIVTRPPSRSEIREFVADLLDRVDCKNFDFAVEIAPKVPSALFCHILDAPLEDRELIAECSTSLLKVFQINPAYRDEIEAATHTITSYIRDHIEHKRSHLGEDGLSRLIEAEQRGETTIDEIINMLFTMLTGSTDTSSATMSQMIIAFAERPDQWDLLRQNPSLLANAVQESIRVRTGIWTNPRFAHKDQEFKGVMIPAGTWMLSSIIGANHDPSVFEDPDDLRIDRKFSRPPLNFGAWQHACVGRPAVLVELEETLRLLVERFSRIEVIGDIVRNGHPHGDYIRHLPVRMTAE
jgi:cytochrome P450